MTCDLGIHMYYTMTLVAMHKYYTYVFITIILGRIVYYTVCAVSIYVTLQCDSLTLNVSMPSPSVN